MKVIPIMPIETFYGKLNSKGNYYFRRSKNGTIYACRCPDRSKHVTSAEVNRRKKFGDIGEMVATRMTDLMTITQDRQAFEAQKNTAGGKKTFKSYLWKVCKEAYEANH